jgi:hypothetical protein
MDNDPIIINTDDPCWEAHMVGTVIPTEDMKDMDGKVCNCGKFVWRWELCGCAKKEYKLKIHQNEG